MGASSLLWFGLAALAVTSHALYVQKPLNPILPPNSLIETGHRQEPGQLEAPIIEQSGASSNPEDAAERAEQLKKIAEIFSKEPPSASGAKDDDSDDVLGLKNDPLDVIGIPKPEPDPADLENQVATLQGEVTAMENATKALPGKTSELSKLQAELATAQTAEAAKEKKASSGSANANKAAMAKMNAEKSTALQTQITSLQNQIKQLQTEQKSLGGSAGGAAGGSAGGAAPAPAAG